MQSIEMLQKKQPLVGGTHLNRPVVGVSQLKIYGTNKSASRSIERSRQLNHIHNKKVKNLLDSPLTMKPSIIPLAKSKGYYLAAESSQQT